MSDYDVIIVGSGLAGLTAGLFAARHGLSTLILESNIPGGHLISIDKIEDFPGFPDGIAGKGFFHKDVPDYFPAFVRRVELPKREGGTITHALANDARSLVYLVGQNTITPHVWLSRADRLDQPDRLVFDLDPPGGDFAAVRRADP